MGKTFKDESFGADGKFRKQRRTHEQTRKPMTERNKTQSTFSESFQEGIDHEDDKIPYYHRGCS